MNTPKALIAMSGGVDSSVAAYLTQQAGFDCTGGMMRLFDRTDPAEQDGAAVAAKLGIPFRIFDFSDFFRERVMGAFVCAYERGDTPNPCVTCNRYLKFDLLLQKARELGCEAIVTGHYARIRRDEKTGRYCLYKSANPEKDQSYALYALTQEQLAHTRFPLGEMTKPQVRAVAQELGLVTAEKRDSQDICFIPDGDYVAFMERFTGHGYPAGDFLNRDGQVVGTHRGAVAYTLGQRKGLGLAMGAPVYVCDKDMEQNTVTVGPNEALFHRSLLASDWNWIPFPALTAPLRVEAKARYRQAQQPATVYPQENGQARVVFDQPQRALTPGQAVVLYNGDQVIGGGTIRKVLKDEA